MISFNWKILEVLSENGQLKHVKYNVTAIDGDKTVETEGYARFELPQEVVFENILEVELLEYVKRFYTQNDLNSIEYRLSEQMIDLQKTVTTEPPWKVETFKLGL